MLPESEYQFSQKIMLQECAGSGITTRRKVITSSVAWSRQPQPRLPMQRGDARENFSCRWTPVIKAIGLQVD